MRGRLDREMLGRHIINRFSFMLVLAVGGKNL